MSATAESKSRLHRFRSRRDLMLSQTDWTQLPDAPLTAQQKAAWATYRQLLRDLPGSADASGRWAWPARPA